MDRLQAQYDAVAGMERYWEHRLRSVFRKRNHQERRERGWYNPPPPIEQMMDRQIERCDKHRITIGFLLRCAKDNPEFDADAAANVVDAMRFQRVVDAYWERQERKMSRGDAGVE